MRILLLLFIATRLLFMTQCDEGECTGRSILDENDIPSIAALTPLESEFVQGSVITFTVTLPSVNNYFGEAVNLLEETSDSTALLVLYADYFNGNTLNYTKGSAAEEQFPERFFMPYNTETQNYEFELQVTLDQLGEYVIPAEAFIEVGLDDCPDFFVNTRFQGVDGNEIRFSVVE